MKNINKDFVMKLSNNSLVIALVLFFILGIVFNSCEEEAEGQVIIEAASLVLISGSEQVAEVGGQLAVSVEVMVKDQDGEAFAGAQVSFFVTEGSVSTESVITDDSGKASVSWTLGATVGEQLLNVVAYGADGKTELTGSPLTIKAIGEAIPKVATSVELVSGDGQTVYVDQRLQYPVCVLVKDQNGEAFEGATVHFSVDEGAVSEATAITNYSGKAVTYWTLGSTIGDQKLTATVYGADGKTVLEGAPLEFVATAKKSLVGTFAQGGIIFYIFQPGDVLYIEGELHGLVCAVKDLEKMQGCPNLREGVDYEYLGGGAMNTLNMIDKASGGKAPWACNDLVLSGYDDWFLPSVSEMDELYKNKDIINTVAVENGGTAFAEGVLYGNLSEVYCTSSQKKEHWREPYKTLLYFMQSGSAWWYSNTICEPLFCVRPVRTF